MVRSMADLYFWFSFPFFPRTERRAGSCRSGRERGCGHREDRGVTAVTAPRCHARRDESSPSPL